MITLLTLDAARHCLATPADTPFYICRAPRGHAGPHEYVPLDMVAIIEKSEPVRMPVEEPAG